MAKPHQRSWLGTKRRERPVPEHRGILKDELIGLNVYYFKKHYPYPLRRIEVRDETKEERIVLITNHLGFAASTICSIYKDRWQIEVFFKTMKQNLKKRPLSPPPPMPS